MIAIDAIGCSVQTLLYGLYVVSFFHCLRWLVFDSEGRRFQPKIPWPMTIVTVVLFVFMTANVATAFQMMLLSLEGNSGSSDYTTTYTVSAGTGVTILLIVDGVLIYRCWMIYRVHDSWLFMIIILPLSFLWIADLISAIIGVIFLALNSGWPSAQQQNSARYTYGLNITYMTYFICEIAINVYATFAIVLQIIYAIRRDTRHNSGRLYKIGLIFVESGILFTLTCMLSLCLKLLATGTNNLGLQLTSLIMNIINVNTAGLTFNLILIRFGKERLQRSEASQDSNKTTIVLTTVQFSVSAQTSESEPP